jgi:hypothetical protein
MRKLATAGRSRAFGWAAQRRQRKQGIAGVGRRVRAARQADVARRIPTPNRIPTADLVCSFGATRVGVLLERLRLHLGTQRFLAARRGDRLWEASCDYAVLAVGRLAARMRPEAYRAELCAAARPARGAR